MFIFQRLRYWIWGGYSIPIILMIVSATVVTLNVSRVRQEAKAVNDSRIIAQYLADLAVDAQIVARASRGYLLEKNSQSLDTFNFAVEDYRRVFPLVDELVEDEQQDATLEQLEGQVNALIEFNESLIQLVDGGQTERAIQTWQGGTGVQFDEEISDLLDRLRAREQEIVELRLASQTQALNNLIWVVWGSIGVAVVISIALGAWIIATIVQKITQEATNIALSATEISTTLEQQERVAVQQAASVNQTTTSMDELGASSRQSAEQASAASNGARQVLDLAGSDRQGNDSFDDTPSLREKMGQVQGQILRLSENLSQIYNITNLVSDLANQTNMLALNASVEAVRAGEHGKGFGVVASEIRKLADQSRKSAEKIGSLITDIQNTTNSTVIVTEEGTKAVEKIVHSINDVAVNIQQISLNAKQQAIAIEQVIDAMNNLNTAAHETANGLAQSKVGTQQLNTTAQNLKNLV